MSNKKVNNEEKKFDEFVEYTLDNVEYTLDNKIFKELEDIIFIIKNPLGVCKTRKKEIELIEYSLYDTWKKVNSILDTIENLDLEFKKISY